MYPIPEKCAICGKDGFCRHVVDYSRPLDMAWLCCECYKNKILHTEKEEKREKRCFSIAERQLEEKEKNVNENQMELWK